MKRIPRNPNTALVNLAIGTIIEVDGTHIVAELNRDLSELSRVYAGDTYPIGQFGSIVKIHFGRRLIFAFVGRLRMKAEYEAERGIDSQASADERIIEADLFGEGDWYLRSQGETAEWILKFERGVSNYPLPQQTLYLTPKNELRQIYGRGKEAVVRLGEHVGTGGTPCFAEMNELIGKHTAILGSTGAGKSGTTAAVIHSLLERGTEVGYENWKPRIIILDPHDEYSAAFPVRTKLSSDDGTLSLPYWMLTLQETVSLLIGKTEFVATSQANIVKKAILSSRHEGATELGLDPEKVTVDSPVPYKLATFRSEVERDKPPQASKQESHNSILEKLDVLSRDSRVNFLMEEWAVADGDPFSQIVTQLIGAKAQPIIVNLSGVPNEVAGVSSAIIARTLFNLKVWQTSEERSNDPVLLVCEEAHRYVPDRGEAQYEAAQEAIRRIAKEGRKYGLGLILVSQRPCEIESTVLSQCNSWIILRITNDKDRAHVQSILPDSMAGLTKMLSGLGRREAIFAGLAAMLPSRILVRSLTREQLPKSHDIDFDLGWQCDPMSSDQLNTIAKRWRYQQR